MDFNTAALLLQSLTVCPTCGKPLVPCASPSARKCIEHWVIYIDAGKRKGSYDIRIEPLL